MINGFTKVTITSVLGCAWSEMDQVQTAIVSSQPCSKLKNLSSDFICKDLWCCKWFLGGTLGIVPFAHLFSVLLCCFWEFVKTVLILQGLSDCCFAASVITNVSDYPFSMQSLCSEIHCNLILMKWKSIRLWNALFTRKMSPYDFSVSGQARHY